MEQTTSGVPAHNCTGAFCLICHPQPPVARTPHKCPVCEGRGNVPCNFYTRADTASSAANIVCNSCAGVGIIYT